MATHQTPVLLLTATHSRTGACAHSRTVKYIYERAYMYVYI